MTLKDQLQRTLREIEGNMPESALKTMHGATAALAESDLPEQSLNLGDAAPGFTLPNALGNAVTLSALLQSGPVVLSFYRGSWCPYCNLALRAMQQAQPQFEQHGASLVMVSPQTPDASLSTQEKNELTFHVLSDTGNAVSRQYGLVFQLPADLVALYQRFGIDLQAYNGDANGELPLPGTFVIGRDGVVRYAFVNVDYRERAEPSDILAALAALS